MSINEHREEVEALWADTLDDMNETGMWAKLEFVPDTAGAVFDTMRDLIMEYELAEPHLLTYLNEHEDEARAITHRVCEAVAESLNMAIEYGTPF